MTRITLSLLCVLVAAGCTVVKPGEGNTTTIQHKPGAEVARDLSDRACKKAGQQRAEIISTVNKDPALPAGTGTQVTTFRCVS